MSFRKDFVWGAATSSYQIEGAYNEDGKGLSVWDMVCEKEGFVYEGHTGKIACDHYHRYKEDVAILKKLGIKAYRFSISWPRIFPDGTGKVNAAGLVFYDNLINELIANGIEPYITLYHWDLPLALHRRGGWLNRDIADWFAEYAALIAKRYSDRVKKFITINEPQCVIGAGYIEGGDAPGLKVSVSDAVVAAHNLMLAHGKAVKAMRENGAPDILIGYAPTGSGTYPHDESSKADIKAARDAYFEIRNGKIDWSWSVSWWSDPVVLGEYPKDGLAYLGEYLPDTWQEDLKTICQPLDFYCQNIYNGREFKAGENGYEKVRRYEGFPRTANGWPITPGAIKWAAKFLYERYKLPIYITENGLSCHDTVSLDGKVHDPNRIDFLHRYILALREAAEEGADIRGYFQWSLMDNFEWGLGYSERFGIVFVDFVTQERIIKDSGYWYSNVIKENGENLGVV